MPDVHRAAVDERRPVEDAAVVEAGAVRRRVGDEVVQRVAAPGGEDRSGGGVLQGQGQRCIPWSGGTTVWSRRSRRRRCTAGRRRPALPARPGRERRSRLPIRSRAQGCSCRAASRWRCARRPWSSSGPSGVLQVAHAAVIEEAAQLGVELALLVRRRGVDEALASGLADQDVAVRVVHVVGQRLARPPVRLGRLLLRHDFVVDAEGLPEGGDVAGESPSTAPNRRRTPSGRRPVAPTVSRPGSTVASTKTTRSERPAARGYCVAAR